MYNSSGKLVGTNDNWQSDSKPLCSRVQRTRAEQSIGSGPSQRTLEPGAYTVIVTGKDATPGIALVELYDISSLSNSKLGNMSTRGSVGTEDNVLIGGFIVGDVASATVIVRAPGPTLASYGVSGGAKRSHTDNLRFEWLFHREQ